MSDILFTESQGVATITLNRPKSLNALSEDMLSKLEEKLLEWREAPNIEKVQIKSSHPKVFCSGADIKAIYYNGIENWEKSLELLKTEYRLVKLIHNYPKPYIAYIDGLVMGGGVGISHHGSQVIASEYYRFSMPEVNIGFFPDVAVCHLFRKIKEPYAKFLMMKGAIINAADAAHIGLIDEKFPGLHRTQNWEEIEREYQVPVTHYDETIGMALEDMLDYETEKAEKYLQDPKMYSSIRTVLSLDD